MLKQAILQSSTPLVLNISDADPSEILVLKGISGLTPADVTLFTGDYARDGGYYQGRRVAKRNPVFKLKINPNYVQDIEVSDIRELLYRTFYEPQALTDGLQVTLVDDRKPDRYFICYTEKWDGDIFEESPDAQISTISVDPFLKSVDITTESDPVGWVTKPFTYDGSADAGFETTIKITSATPQLTLDLNGETMVIFASLAINDLVYINTKPGERKILKNGVTSLLGGLSSQSRWLTIKQPSNTFKVYGSVAPETVAAMQSYSYRSNWWGV